MSDYEAVARAADESGIILEKDPEQYIEAALRQIYFERVEQNDRWGGFPHDVFHNPEHWLTYMLKHLSDYGESIQEYEGYGMERRKEWFVRMLHDVTQVAALACATMEQLQMRIDTAVQQDRIMAEGLTVPHPGLYPAPELYTEESVIEEGKE